MTSLCKYSGIAGLPNEGAHRHRIFGFAAVDIIGTGIGSMILTKILFDKPTIMANIIMFILVMLIGVFAHEIFCVKTRLNIILFSSNSSRNIISK